MKAQARMYFLGFEDASGILLNFSARFIYFSLSFWISSHTEEFFNNVLTHLCLKINI